MPTLAAKRWRHGESADSGAEARTAAAGARPDAPGPLGNTTRARRDELSTDHLRLDIRRRTMRGGAVTLAAQAIREYQKLEAESLGCAEHVFTFGRHVRDHLIAECGLPEDRVTAVGSGAGKIEPYCGSKDYAAGTILFVAKHMFREKGGELLVEAFLLALRQRPGLRLIIVGDPTSQARVPRHPNIQWRTGLPWLDLQSLYRQAVLLAEPMLNDPWGQVYLEALLSRTPVLGLNRNGLPEIAGDGDCGFLVDDATPAGLAQALIAATDDPARLQRMATEGQRHVLERYSWRVVAARLLYPGSVVDPQPRRN